MRHALPIVIMWVLMLAAAGCDRPPMKPASAQAPSFEQRGQLSEQHRVEGYDVSFYREADTGEGSLVIRREGRRVYATHGHMFSLKAIEKRPHRFEPGDDITGDGAPNLVVNHWSGGAHCCFDKYVFQLGDQFRLLEKIEGRDTGVTFKQLDQAPDLEAVIGDPTFTNWKAAFAYSPMPRVVLKWDGETYAVAGYLMRQPEPDRWEWSAMMERFQKPEFWAQPISGRSALWAQMLDLMYSGHPDLGWALLDRTWPDDVPGRAAFKEALREQLRQSPYYVKLPWARTADRDVTP